MHIVSRRIILYRHSLFLLPITYSSLAAAFYPSLFTSLILVDPVVLRPNDRKLLRVDNTSDLAFGALGRRDTWPSRYDPHSNF